MAANDQELSWAKTLQTRRQHAVQTNNADWPMKAVQVAKDLAEGKRMLKQALAEKNASAIEESVKTLIRLRAEQLSCAIHKYREHVDTEDQNFLARLIAQYKKDCHDLITSVDSTPS